MYVYFAVAILVAALSGASVWKIQNWRHDSQAKAQMEAQREKERNDRRAIDAAAVGHEKDKVQIRTQIKTVKVEVEKVIEKPFYVASEQCFDDDGLRQLREAAGSAEPASKPAPALPGR
jgi:hypothetical protein